MEIVLIKSKIVCLVICSAEQMEYLDEPRTSVHRKYFIFLSKLKYLFASELGCIVPALHFPM